VEHVRHRTYLDETHKWYELRLGSERPHRDLPPETELAKAGPEQVRLLQQLPTIRTEVARERMEVGQDLWMVLDGERAAFACWILHGSMSFPAAPGGSAPLPPEVVCLEDSVTSEAYRGKSIAPAAWSSIADVLERDGVRSIITKIEETNIPSRKAISKAGFEEIATMHFRRLGPSSSTKVEAGEGATAAWLAAKLTH